MSFFARYRWKSASRRMLGAVCLASVSLTLASCSFFGEGLNQPPDSDFTQAEAYTPMEAAASAAVAVLPDFPGFEKRTWYQMPCTRNGVDDPDYTMVEITYEFSSENSESEMVRESYVDELREFWISEGYEITDDTETARGERLDRALVAQRDDGIALWYRVLDLVVFTIQSGCVPVSDPGGIEYIAPIGGIEPGSEGDAVGRYFPDGIPTDQAAAIDPFEGTQASAGLVPFDSPGSYEDQL